MEKQRLLTRKTYREELSKRQRSLEKSEDAPKEFTNPSLDSPSLKKSYLERYNRFLTIWISLMIFLFLGAILIQVWL